VTFLLFIASVAILEYLLRDVHRQSGDTAAPDELKKIAGSDPSISHTSTADLLNLGRALDAQKVGKTVDSEHAPQASVLD
jgi:hypothetical protein